MVLLAGECPSPLVAPPTSREKGRIRDTVVTRWNPYTRGKNETAGAWDRQSSLDEDDGTRLRGVDGAELTLVLVFFSPMIFHDSMGSVLHSLEDPEGRLCLPFPHSCAAPNHREKLGLCCTSGVRGRRERDKRKRGP